MLAIKKDHKAMKVITAGCIAFSVGLTGAAAHLNSAFEHQNLVLNKEQSFKNNAQKKSDKADTAKTDATSSDQGASTAGSSAGSQTPVISAPGRGSSSAVPSAPTSPSVGGGTTESTPVIPTPTSSETPPPAEGGLVETITNLLPTL